MSYEPGREPQAPDTYFRLDSDWRRRTAWAADTLAGLHDLGVLVPVEIDYENPVTYLHATIWSLRNDWEADRPMPNEDELQHWVERIIALSIEGGNDDG